MNSGQMTTEQFNQLWQGVTNPTREDRIKIAYLAMAGTYPGPCQAVIAAMLAHRIVDLEDTESAQ